MKEEYDVTQKKNPCHQDKICHTMVAAWVWAAAEAPNK
jgi:hypothetical protein